MNDISYCNYNSYINVLEVQKKEKKKHIKKCESLIVTDETKKIIKLEKELNKLKYNIALSRIFENNDDIELNLKLNGFGLFIIRENKYYRILYDFNKYNINKKSKKIKKIDNSNIINIFDKINKKKNEDMDEENKEDMDEENKEDDNKYSEETDCKRGNYTRISLLNRIFYKYQIDITRSFLIIKSNSMEDDILNKDVDHELMIYNNIKIDYNKDLIVDFNKELYSNKEFKTNSKKREIIKVLKDLYNLSEMKKETHSQSSKKYNCYNYSLVFPSIIISASSGILSFISSSSIIDDSAKIYFSIGVGILASITTFIQSISNALNFSGKMESHNMATNEYEHINTLLKFELNNPTETLKDPTIFYNKIKSNILDIKKKCKYTVPKFIQNKYEKNKLNTEFKHIKYDILNEAFSKKAQQIKNKFNRQNYKLNMDNINNKMSYIIPIDN